MKNQTTNPINQYYSDVSAKIIALIKDTKYVDALELLNDELAQPYIPNEIFQKFRESRNDVEKMLKEKIYAEKFSKLTKQGIWNAIYNESKNFIDVSYISILLEKYEHEIDAYDISMINHILNDKKIDNLDKWLLTSIILELNLDFEFSIFNTFLNKQMYFTLKTLHDSQTQMVFIANSLERELAKHPSELEIALQLLQVLHTKFIPNQISYDNHVIINTLKNAVLALFNQEQLVKNEITKLLEEFLG